MVVKETVGLRKKNAGVRKRGKARRDQLLKAAYDLLCERSVEEISLISIADRAEIPEGSAYHFFSNKYDVFAALAQDLSEKFIQVHRKPIRRNKLKTWQDLADLFVVRGARVYKDNPPATQLFIGGKTPPEIKLQDRINDRVVAATMQEIFSNHFNLPDISNLQNIFYFFIEITDLMFSLSMLEHGKITDEMLEEAQRAGKAYLGVYFPEIIELNRQAG